MNSKYKRQGQMELQETYFYTQTIENFRHLLKDDNIKMILIQSLQYLVKMKLVKVFGYVIMPNHLHLLWTSLKLNGKESPATSFTKYTSHNIKKHLQENDAGLLKNFTATQEDREYKFWKRDPLAIPLDNLSIVEQKLEYIHNNPIVEKWALCSSPEEYKWSSANFYLFNFDPFAILTHYKD